MTTFMDAAGLFAVLDALEGAGCPVWIEGGWGVDALVGRQTRPHGDADLDFDVRDEARVIEALSGLGYREVLDERPTRFVLTDPEGHCIDLHPLRFAPDGDAVQDGPEGQQWHFEAQWFSTGSLDGHPVPCYTVEAQLRFHQDYELRDVDRADLAVLGTLAGIADPGLGR